LLYSYGTPEVMLGQIDRLLLCRPASDVRFGIVPVLTRWTPSDARHLIFDDSVIIETNDSEIVPRIRTTWRSTTASWTVVPPGCG